MNVYYSALIKTSLVLVISLSACTPKEEQTTPWINLFDGKTLKGWHIENGEAEYFVEDGMLVGKAKRNTPNTFLCSDSLYTDFILEFSFKADADLNSGVQFRSNQMPEYQNSRVHGYQSELDPTDRQWTAGIYDEGRREWLVTLTENPEAQKAYIHKEWNNFRIEAIGDTIKTFVNGVPAAHLVDDMTSTGFFGLQVHSIGDDEKMEGATVRWKDIRIITDNPRTYATPSSLPAVNTLNTLSVVEKDRGWNLLFDGESVAGWRGAKLDSFPTAGWKVENGILTIYESGGGEAAGAGDIITREKFKNFELKVDFKITEGANSGIKYYVDPEINKGEGSSIGLEYQILDDERHPDAKLGNHEGSRTLGSLYDLIKADNKVINPIGEWNVAYIKSKDNHVEHWLNGIKILEYDRGTPEYRKLVAESKYKVWENFGELAEGHILLQDHGNTVSFRNIKIHELK